MPVGTAVTPETWTRNEWLMRLKALDKAHNVRMEVRTLSYGFPLGQRFTGSCQLPDKTLRERAPFPLR
jgi:hypothetical protein